MPKNRSNDLIENAAFELPMEFKFNLTGVLLQGNEIPLTRKMLKRAIYEHHINGFWAMVDITGVEVLCNALELNIDFGFLNGFGLFINFYAATPRQEFGIASDIGYQTVHSLG